MTQRKSIVVSAAATTTSQWYDRDYRYDQNTERAFFMSMASTADTWTLQVADETHTYVYNVSAFTGVTSADGVLVGNWPAVRMIYVGASGGTFCLMG